MHEPELQMNFTDLGLVEPLVRAVHEHGYDTPTPIQAQAIPTILSGADLMGGAQTGTGKTAGFTLPMLQRLMAQPRRARCQGPAADPCADPHAHARTRRAGGRKRARLRQVQQAQQHGDVRGVGMQPQIDKLRRGVDILVATPGRCSTTTSSARWT